MALVVFLRGVNIGAAGTFVVRKPGSRAKFLAALLRKLPFDTQVAICDERDLMRLEKDHPFGAAPERRDIVRFVSVMVRASRARASVPMTFPASGQWLLRIVASRDR